jgi:hypothetical protein
LVLVEFSEECWLVRDQRLSGFGGHGFVGVKVAVAPDVEHGVAALNEHAADKQAAVTMGGVFLAAKQGHAKALHAGFKAGDGCPEASVVAEAAIEDAARGVVIGRIGGTATEFSAEKEVANSRFLQGPLDGFLVKLRNVLGVRVAARIHNHLDLVLSNKRKPGFEVVVGVAESEETAHLRALATRIAFAVGPLKRAESRRRFQFGVVC